jgi:hypothetical protein
MVSVQCSLDRLGCVLVVQLVKILRFDGIMVSTEGWTLRKLCLSHGILISGIPGPAFTE